MPKTKTQPASVHGVISGTLPAFRMEAKGRQELPVKQNETVDLEPFVLECEERGLSVAQVLQAIKDRTLIMITPAPDLDEIPLRDSYNENNILRFMRSFNVRFFLVDADWFWEKTVPDHNGGWKSSVASREREQANGMVIEEVHKPEAHTDAQPKEIGQDSQGGNVDGVNPFSDKQAKLVYRQKFSTGWPGDREHWEKVHRDTFSNAKAWQNSYQRKQFDKFINRGRELTEPHNRPTSDPRRDTAPYNSME